MKGRKSFLMALLATIAAASSVRARSFSWATDTSFKLPALVFAFCFVGVAACENLVLFDDAVKEEFLTWKFGMFLHFNVATFNDVEWANGYEDPATFSPDSLDAEQWAEAAVSAGMTYGVLTVKHTGGWSLWDSETTTHDIAAFEQYQDGRGDVVREFVDAFRSHGLRVGLYYCFPGDYDGRFGNALPEGKPSLHGLPPEARGGDMGLIKDQLTELLTRYGTIDLLWIDQYRSPHISARQWNAVRNHVRSVQPMTYILGNNSRKDRETDIHSYEYPLYRDQNPEQGLPPADNTDPAEVSDVIGSSWFWNTSTDRSPLKSASDIVAMLNLANARHANYLLNVAPDTSGRIPPAAVERLKEVGDRIRAETSQ